MLDFARRLAPAAVGAAVPVMSPRWGGVAAAPSEAASAIPDETTTATRSPPRSAMPIEHPSPPTRPPGPLVSLPARLADPEPAAREAARPMAPTLQPSPPGISAPIRASALPVAEPAPHATPAHAQPAMPIESPARVELPQLIAAPRRPLSEATLATRQAVIAEQRQQQHAQQQRRQDPTPARPVVHLTIDRLEVRAAAPARTPTPSPRPAAAPSVSLGDYLRGRS